MINDGWDTYSRFFSSKYTSPNILLGAEYDTNQLITERDKMNIRMIASGEAQRFLELNHRLDRETKFMLLEPGERTTTVDLVQERIEHTLKQDNEAVFVVEVGNTLVGYASVIGGRLNRTKHKASVVTGILQEYAGKGIGGRLFDTLVHWAKESPLQRLELTVMTHNERAIALYKRYGFEIEGTHKHSLMVDGALVDEFGTALLL